MGINFPSSPTLGQKYPAPPIAGIPTYAWDGEKWTTAGSSGAASGTPSDGNPSMNGTATPGGSPNYARGDHIHPTDTSRAPFNNPSFTGTVTASTFENNGTVALAGMSATTINSTGGTATFGSLTVASASLGAFAPTLIASMSKGHRLGVHGGTGAGGAVTPADANILFYNYGSGNWSGLGVDGSGNFWVRTGNSGTPAPAFYVGSDQVVVFSKSPTAPTPPVGDDTNKLATTNFVRANPATGAYLPLSGGALSGQLNVFNGDIYSYRAGGAAGVCYLSNGDRYLYWDGTNYSCGGAPIVSAAGRLWGGADFGFPVSNGRLAMAADFWHAWGVGLQEPYGGAVWSGLSGSQNWDNVSNYRMLVRYRYFQLYTTGWFTVGYA